ncbi:CGI-121-domain-containing protein [Calocera cornea HHB12733]|uniref:EKC/KEOPS complex subunit CGI121 n=1 Tax=Calocera cornea HHB12733 TaxID=1353952 RepID=A0A165JEL8_9BASI|nr:CGI-121-domain-containing protein [Calocera cornea HHB12733]
MESYPYPHLGLTFHIALFTSLSEPTALLQRLIHASTLPPTPEGEAARDAVNFAFIDAAMVTSKLVLLTAAYQACIAEWEGTMKTKTVHSEVLWCLSPGRNITDALRYFGLSGKSKSLLVLHICPTAAQDAAPDDPQLAANVEARMRDVIQGQLVPLDTLISVTDWPAIRKVYKLASDASLSQIQQSAASKEVKEKETNEMMDQTVVSIVAMKSVAA